MPDLFFELLPSLPVVVILVAGIIESAKRRKALEKRCELQKRGMYIAKHFGDCEIGLYRFSKSNEICCGDRLARAWVLREIKPKEGKRKAMVLDKCFDDRKVSETEQDVYDLLRILPYHIEVFDTDMNLDLLTENEL